MAQVKANGIHIEYERYGDKASPPLLLIMGLGGQLTNWPKPWIEAFLAAGLQVIVFDNRDIGLTDKMHSRKPPSILWQTMRQRSGLPLAKAPYNLETMATDTAKLMEALDIPSAHVFGISMGGMIGQVLAATYPEKIRTFTAVMTSTNHKKVPSPSMKTMRSLFMARPKSSKTSDLLDFFIETHKYIGTPGDTKTDEERRAHMAVNLERSYYPEGTSRQTAAVMASGDLSKYARAVKAPTLVLHGTEDILVDPKGGADVAAKIPGARLVMIQGMGHDLPQICRDEVIELATEHMLTSKVFSSV